VVVPIELKKFHSYLLCCVIAGWSQTELQRRSARPHTARPSRNSSPNPDPFFLEALTCIALRPRISRGGREGEKEKQKKNSCAADEPDTRIGAAGCAESGLQIYNGDMRCVQGIKDGQHDACRAACEVRDKRWCCSACLRPATDTTTKHFFNVEK
jgi:hypothetical protein